MLSMRDSLGIQRYKQVESENMEKDISCISNQMSTGMAVLISDKIDFK